MNKTDLRKSIFERLINGIFKENPTFVLLLGMCPTLAVTTSAKNGLGMGLTTMVVLALSNLFISALRKIIPDKIRIPAFIVIIASFVTIVELLLKAYIPGLYDSLGLYIPLIVVNCIILGRAEAYAYSHPVIPSFFDGVGMGLGFSMALTIIGAFREILGAGTVFGARIMPDGFIPVNIFVMAPGAFFVLAMLTALQNKIKEIGTKKGLDMSKIQSGCGGNCSECIKECKDKDSFIKEAEEAKAEEIKEEEAKAEETEAEETEAEETNSEEEKLSFGTKLSNMFAGLKESFAEKKAQREAEKEESSTKESDIKESDTNETEIKEDSEDDTQEASKEISENDNDLTVEESHEEVEVTDDGVLVEEKPSDEVSEEETNTSEVNIDPYKVTEEELEQEDAIKPSDEDDEFEFLDLADYKKEISKNEKSVKRPLRKKSSVDKAKALLFKAEETLKEGEDD